MPVSAARIGVCLVDQLLDRLFTIALYMRRHPLRNRYQSVINNQRTEIRSFDLLLNDDPTRIFLSLFPSYSRVFDRLDPDRSTFAVISVKRLDNGGKSDALERVFEILFIADPIAFRHRHTHIAQ